MVPVYFINSTLKLTNCDQKVEEVFDPKVDKKWVSWKFTFDWINHARLVRLLLSGYVGQKKGGGAKISVSLMRVIICHLFQGGF